MAISKIILNGVTQMDVTGKTVTSASMRNGVTALKNDGTDVTGTIPDMTLPSASSATSSGTSKATITPTSSAQYLNIPEGYNDTAQFYTIAAAGGGASNMVTGTFTGTTTGAAINVNIPYSGTGFPLVVSIFPSASSISTIASLIQRYAIIDLTIVKANTTSPNYSTSSGNNQAGIVVTKYKNSASTSTNYGQAGGSGTVTIFNDAAATSSSTTSVKVTSNKTMSVYIASTSYGFAANIEYTYIVIYSA